MVWEPTVDIGEWGRLQIVINDTDVTFFRNVPTQIQSWSSGDPFDDAACVIRLPQTSPFERAGVKELAWLQGHSSVEINLLRPNGNKKPLWEGMVASIEDDVSDTDAGIVIQCIGALYQLDYFVRSPQNLSEKKQRLYERAIAAEFHPKNKDRESLRTGKLKVVYPEGMTNTGFKTRYSGGWEKVLTGYIQRLLADMVHNPGFIKDPGSPAIPGIPGVNEVQAVVLAPEPPPWPWGSSYPSRTLKGTFALGFRGERTTGLRWNSTATDVRNRLRALSTIDDVKVTGSGTKASPWRITFTGAKVRQRPQPLLKLYHSDLRHYHSHTRVTRVTAGEKGTPGTPATPASDPEPWEGAWTLMKRSGRRPVLRMRNEVDVTWTVSTGAPGVAHNLKSDFSQTPNVIYGEGTDESATTWRNSVVDVDRKGETVTRHHPIAWEEAVYPAKKTESEAGEPTDPPSSAYHGDNVRVEVIQKYGAGVSLLDARRSADQQLQRERDPGWFGTISLTTDPEEGSRFEIKAGSNIRLKHFRNEIPPAKEIYAKLVEMGIFTSSLSTNPLTRAQYSLVLVRMMSALGQPVPAWDGNFPFPDVTSTTNYYKSINRLQQIGVAKAYVRNPDAPWYGHFRATIPLTRAQMAAMIGELVQWATAENYRATYQHFNDYVNPDVSNLADINRAIEHYIIPPVTNKAFYPERDATREEVAVVLYLLSNFLGQPIIDPGLVVHVAQAETNFESGTVDLTVDSKFRDLTTLAQLIERTKSENKNPAKMLMVNRESGNTDDTKFPWDYAAGSGSLPKASRAARHVGALPKGTPVNNPTWFTYVNGANSDPWKRWKVIPMVAAGKGSVARSEVRAFNSKGKPLKIPFHVGIYSMYITEYSMPKAPFSPGAFTRSEEDALAGFDPSAVVLWGQEGQRAGYWPGLESEGNPVTGILLDEGTWQFQLPEGENVLWVAIYAETNAYFQGRFYHGVQ